MKKEEIVMNWYKKAKLSDKDPSEEIIFTTCQYCGRWATQEGEDVVDEDARVWKKNEQLNSEESYDVAKVMEPIGTRQEGVHLSHGICPYCMDTLRTQGFPSGQEETNELINMSLRLS